MESEQAYQQFKIAQKILNSTVNGCGGNGSGVDGGGNGGGGGNTGDSNKSDHNNDYDQRFDRLKLFHELWRTNKDQQQQLLSQSQSQSQQNNSQHQQRKNDIDDYDISEYFEGCNEQPLKTQTMTINNHQVNNGQQFDDIEQLLQTYFTDQCTKQQTQSQSQLLLPLQNEPLNLNCRNDEQQGQQTSTTGDGNVEGGVSGGVKNLIECNFTNVNDQQQHVHCLITGCHAVILKIIPDLLDHMRKHEYIFKNTNLLQITSIEGFFNRKRGRPPKNRVVEVYNNVSNRYLYSN